MKNGSKRTRLLRAVLYANVGVCALCLLVGFIWDGHWKILTTVIMLAVLVSTYCSVELQKNG